MTDTLRNQKATFINEAKIAETLAAAAQRSDAGRVREVLSKARRMVGLDAS